MQRTLLVGLLVIMSVVVIGGGVAFRQLHSAQHAVEILLEGQKSLLLREQLRDTVLTLDSRLETFGQSEGRQAYEGAVRDALAIADSCSGCHHDPEAAQFIGLIEKGLHEAVDGVTMMTESGAPGRSTFGDLRSLTELATRAGGDLVRKRAESARELLAGGRIIVGSVAVCSLLILAGASWWASRRITKDVGRVVEATRRVVEHGAEAVEKNAFGREFRPVGDALRTMAERLQHKERGERDSLVRKLQAERVLSLARFAGGIAHEVNNPLTGVVGFADLLLQKPEGLSEEQKEYLQRIRDSGQSAAEIIQTLMSLAQTSAPRRQNVRLDAIAGHVVEGILVGKVPGTAARIKRSLAATEINADLAQIEQVIFCVVDNAVQAIGDSGVVTVETGTQDGQGILRVRDTGPGIPEDALPRIFDPFFTTREVGQGFGLGLAVSKQIIESHGGTIALTSSLGKGTLVEIRLPLAAGETG